MIKTTETKVDKIGLTCCDNNTNKKISNITLNPANPQLIYEGLISKEFDYIKIPTKNCIDFETSCENPYALPKNNLSFVGNPIFEKEYKKENKENKKEKEKKKIMELLELYEKFQTENIEKSFDKQIDEILEKDELVQAAKEYNQRLNLLEDNVRKERLKLDIERVLTVETQNEVNIIKNTIREATYKLKDKCNIIKAHLELADTFEEKQAILKSYNVIDENDKLNILSQEEENIADEINEKLEILEEKTRKDKKVWKK